ncbi:MAG: MotA/TolQ/ExbB proton channel family protein [Treponema sp.]|nr:MotA/TolQ/ExbB proton channel family protein [Treponema sp.]
MEPGNASFSLLEFFRLGGIFMWPLLFFSIATVAIALERGVYLIYHNLALDDLRKGLLELLRSNRAEEAEAWLEKLTRRRMGARILLVLLRGIPLKGKRKGLPEQRLERAVEAEALSCVNSLENGFNFLIALGSLSPLTGFLGTVSGMIGAFRSISEAVDVNAQIVANGIYEALITTVFGLVIAIIAMVAHSLFSHVVDKFAAEVEKTCSDLFIELYAEEEGGGNEIITETQENL